MNYFSIHFSFVDGLGMSTDVAYKEEVIPEIKKYDHEGCSWSVYEITDITDDIRKEYER